MAKKNKELKYGPVNPFTGEPLVGVLPDSPDKIIIDAMKKSSKERDLIKRKEKKLERKTKRQERRDSRPEWTPFSDALDAIDKVFGKTGEDNIGGRKPFYDSDIAYKTNMMEIPSYYEPTVSYPPKLPGHTPLEKGTGTPFKTALNAISDWLDKTSKKPEKYKKGGYTKDSMQLQEMYNPTVSLPPEKKKVTKMKGEGRPFRKLFKKIKDTGVSPKKTETGGYTPDEMVIPDFSGTKYDNYTQVATAENIVTRGTPSLDTTLGLDITSELTKITREESEKNVYPIEVDENIPETIIERVKKAQINESDALLEYARSGNKDNIWIFMANKYLEKNNPLAAAILAVKDDMIESN